MREVRFSKSAAKELENLLIYLETEWSENVKWEFVEKLDHSIKTILTFPKAFPESSKKEGVFRCVVTKHTSIIYQRIPTGILVVSFFDNRQDPAASGFAIE